MRSHSADDLWQKFNNTCNSSYELCIPFIEREEKNRLDNLLQKTAICDQLENYISSMGWTGANKTHAETSESKTDIDWIQVDKITRQARKEWSAIGFVDRKEHKQIKQRFKKSIQLIRNELNQGWQINQQKFEDLITKVEDLREIIETDLNSAINQAKKYQQQWKTIGPISSHQRTKLWKKFRTACDVIFNKRQAGIDEKNSHNDELIREKEAICENLEALNQQPLKKKDLQIAYDDIRHLWSELQTKGKSLAKPLNQRYIQAEKEYLKKLDLILEQDQKDIIEGIKEKASYCTKIEEQVAMSEKTAMSEDDYQQFQQTISQQWQSIISLPTTTDTELNTRYEQALNMLQAGISEHQLAAIKESELKLKQDFCLQYEIMSAKESPIEFEQERMQMQVELLNKNMGQQQQISAFELQLQWYKITNYTQDKVLQDRFNNLLS